MIHVGEKKYHTPLGLASFMVSLIPPNRYQNAIDICCGSWNLLKAVKAKWPNVRITGVDLDFSASLDMPFDATFRYIDGRSFALENRDQHIGFDLVVANPPFGKNPHPIIKKNYIETYGFKAEGIIHSRLEAEMIFANTLLVKPTGVLAAIVPSSFVEADSFLMFRKSFSEKFSVLNIVKIIGKAFKGSEVRSYIIIAQKELPRNTGDSKLSTGSALEIGNEWEYSFSKNIMREEFIDSSWLSQSNNKIIADQVSNLKILRGKYSSQMFKDQGIPILHNGSGSDLLLNTTWWKSGMRYIMAEEEIGDAPKVSDGDIVINRIGRNAGRWYIYEGNDIGFSDCLFVIKSKQKEELYRKLRIIAADGKLNMIAKGVATQYITKRDLAVMLAI